MFVLLIYVSGHLTMTIGPFDDEADAWVFHEHHLESVSVMVTRLVDPATIKASK